MLGDIFYVFRILFFTMILIFALQFKVNGVTLEDRTYDVMVKSGFAQDVRLSMQRGIAFLGEKFGSAGGELKQKSEKISESAQQNLRRTFESDSH